MKGYVTKIIVVRETGRATLRTRKFVDTPMGETVVEDLTAMGQTKIHDWLLARGWYYAGHVAGTFTYKPGHKAVTLTVEV